MNCPASLEVDSRFVPAHKVVTNTTTDTTVNNTNIMFPMDSFDMGLLEQATTALVEEPFPSIIWVFNNNNDDPSCSGEHTKQNRHHQCKFSPQCQFFFMSPQARRLKRRRRGRGSGYLVRCLEAQSLLFWDDDDDGNHRADGPNNEQQHRPNGASLSDSDFSQTQFGSESILSNDLSQSSRSDNSNASDDTRP
jgi:hypothetical protein